MTVSSEISKTSAFACNGVTTVFPYAFLLIKSGHAKVTLTAEDGTQTILALNIDYFITGVGVITGGTIITVEPYATGNTLVIERVVPLLQEVDLQNQGAFYAEVIEEALDLALMRDQQIYAQIANAIRVPQDETGGYTLPTKTLRANKYLRFDDDGQPSVVDSQVSTVYYGALSTDPTARPDGSARQLGDLYYSTTSSVIRVFNGASWQAGLPTSSLTLVNYTETAASAKTTFTIAGGYTVGTVFVYLNGALLFPGELTATNGTTIVLATACAIGDEFRCIGYSPLSVADTLAKSAQLADLPDAAIARANLGINASEAEIAYLSGVTAGIQSQINARVRKSTDETLNAGYIATSVNDGIKTTGSYALTPAGGNMRQITNGGTFTIVAPSLSGDYSMVLFIQNNGSAGAITLSGFSKSTGDIFSTVSSHKFLIYITKIGTSTHCHVQGLQ